MCVSVGLGGRGGGAGGCGGKWGGGMEDSRAFRGRLHESKDSLKPHKKKFDNAVVRKK